MQPQEFLQALPKSQQLSMEAVAFLQQHYYERFGYPLCWKVCLFPQFFLLMLLLIQSVFHISRKI
ncbi:MAG: hypothetical protein MSA74_08590, partial [Ruminococcus sp.]|nr:hypothetical protein [Ruminococcus sp.]